MDKPFCAVTMGDPAGIGPEVILKSLSAAPVSEDARLVVIGYPAPFERDKRLLGIDLTIDVLDSIGQYTPKHNTLSLLPPDSDLDIPLDYGLRDERCGLAAARSIELSARLAMNGDVDAVVTAPINKESFNMAGYRFEGHTEFYQHLTGAGEIAMLLTLGDFRVIHVTTHTAVRNVPGLVTRERIITVTTLLHETLVLLGIGRPKIALCGLNPHAGESGLFGDEEATVLIPAAGELRRRGLDITDPLPPDTVFSQAYNGAFDGVVAMFHDQGHIAVKMAAFQKREAGYDFGGVNTTLGLPIIRTSVAHGTAFDIAGKNVASSASMLEAIDMAVRLARGRKAQKNG